MCFNRLHLPHELLIFFGTSLESPISSYSILVVEDDAEFRHLLREALSIFNHTVTEAENGSEALTLLKSDRFDLIFSDITMGGMSGLEFTKSARELGIVTPIIAITGHSDKDTIEESLANGISDYILKPLRIRDLPVIIERNVKT